MLSCLPLTLSAQQSSSNSSTSPQAQVVPSQLTGPPPAQIAAAHTVFLSSAGADPNFPIDSARAYNDLYAQLRDWGHYQLVASAADADLVLELHGVSPITNIYGDQDTVRSYSTPAFELRIIDAHTDAKLWTIVSPVVLAGGKKTYDHWVSLSEGNVVSRLKVLAGQPLTSAQTDDLTTTPKTHGTRTVLIFGAVVVAIAGGSALLFEHEVANGRASQDAFCRANGIAPAQCAGGSNYALSPGIPLRR